MSELGKEISLPNAAIIIATYNYGEWLLGAVKSAANQDYPAKTIVVCDDFSQDNSIQSVLGYAGTSEVVSLEEDQEKIVYKANFAGVPLLYIRLKQNSGPSKARNVGIKYVFDTMQAYMILDADDIAKKTKLSKSMAKLLEDPEQIGFVSADYDLVNVESGVVSYESKRPYSREAIVRDCITHSAILVSRSALQRVGLYDEELRVCEDYNLFLRLSNFFVGYHIPEDLSMVRITPKNSTATVPQATWEKNYMMAKYRALGGVS